MTTIIAIVGPSGSGKTEMTFFCKKELGIPYIVSYTTREKRPEEVDGVDHYFVTPNDRPDPSEMLAYTLYGGKEYWAKIPDKTVEMCTYAIDEDGLLNLKEHHSDKFRIIPVYIRREDRGNISKSRMKRDKTRKTTLPMSDYYGVIENSGTLEDFHKTIKFFIEKIKNERTFLDYYCTGKFAATSFGIYGLDHTGNGIRALDLIDGSGFPVYNVHVMEEVTKKLNGEPSTLASGGYDHIGSFIRRNGEYCLLVRGWNTLTETYNLSSTEAQKIQKDFAEWICNKLNK